MGGEMTICVGIQVNDCLVFAADSASSMIGQDPGGNPLVTNVYNNGRKVFALRKGLPIMAMTCGMGNISGSSIDVLAKDFRSLLTSDKDWAIDPKSFTIEDVCNKAHAYFYDEQYLKDPTRPTGDHSFELFVAGISSGERLGEIWKISIINGTPSGPVCVSPRGQCGIVWSGQPEALNRLVIGFSIAVPQALSDAGIEKDQLDKLITAIRAKTQAELTHPAMPVQDAIELADFLVGLTISFTRFLPGANTVGGAVDVATVTRHEGFKWIRRKLYYPAHLN